MLDCFFSYFFKKNKKKVYEEKHVKYIFKEILRQTIDREILKKTLREEIDFESTEDLIDIFKIINTHETFEDEIKIDYWIHKLEELKKSNNI